jgi:hypothetical protein
MPALLLSANWTSFVVFAATASDRGDMACDQQLSDGTAASLTLFGVFMEN